MERIVELPDEVKDLHSLLAVCEDGLLKVNVSLSTLHLPTSRMVPVSGAVANKL